MAGREHTLDKRKVHHKWDKRNPPAIEIDPGDTVHCETAEVTNNQVTPGCDASVMGKIDFAQLYPLAGPIYVNSAEPGDILEVDILRLNPLKWGWAGIIPGLGLLAEDFNQPYIRHFDLSNGSTAPLRDDVQIPIQPFCGTMGVATDEDGAFDVLPPTKGAGNIDTRHLTVGARLHLPVYVPGALFSAGDCHAAQGDGEVCVAAIECGMKASLRFELVKQRSSAPWFVTQPGSLTPKSDVAGYFGTTGIAPDLMEGARMAVRQMIELLGDKHGLDPKMAYMLCSLAGDLKIYEIVDMGMWNVGMCMPRVVFT